MDGKQEFSPLGPGDYSPGAEAATVPVFATDTEVPMVSRERWEQIRHLYGVEGMKISEIARANGLDGFWGESKNLYHSSCHAINNNTMCQSMKWKVP
ncbi:MAG: hypothetical protein HYU77_16540 [Betaproteobacteria bacterium]|nr:hypothetical protein [Betaproteobacteria bacterium]